MRVVLDTNFLVSALKSNLGASYAIISQIPSKHFQTALTIPLYVEYQDVLTRPYERNKFSRGNPGFFKIYLQCFSQAAGLFSLAAMGL